MAIPRRAQVGIIGAGPSGLLLARLLHQEGIDAVVFERRSREHVEGRIRAGVLEQGTAAVLDRAGVAEGMRSAGHVHEGIQVAFDDRLTRVDLQKHAGTSVVVYGQTEITKELCRRNLADGIDIRFEVEATAVADLDRSSARIAYRSAQAGGEIACDYVAGCDGYRGASRRSVPDRAFHVSERTWPFGWLGVLSNTRPAAEELIYSSHARGFALCSQRSTTISRHYVQVAADEKPDAWSDDAFWDELRRRLPSSIGETVETGPSFEKSVAPLRSVICEPLRCGRLFLVGDAGHIVPPTGAKGLNLAVADAAMLASALQAFYAEGEQVGLERYSSMALARVWNAERFSWWFTSATHKISDDAFDRRMQAADLEYFTSTDAGRRVFAENYVGMPIIDPVTGLRLV